MEKVKKLRAAGASFSAAVKDSLELSVTEVAEKHRLHRGQLSEMINLRRVPDEGQLVALAQELGGSPDELRELWFEAAREIAGATVATT